MGLGSNLGERQVWIGQALKRLEGLGVEVVRRSSVYETEPLGIVDQPDFLNLAVEVETELDPRSLMESCLQVEQSLGRRRGEKNGPRNIDIDMLYYGDRVTSSPSLTLPHPRIADRAFALKPLAEIASDFLAPDSGKTVGEMLRICPDSSRVRLWKEGNLTQNPKA